VAIFGSIGIVPSPDSMGIFTFQFKSIEADDAPCKTFKLQSLNSLGGPDNQNLYIAIQAVNVVRGNGVEFEVFHWKGKSDRIFSTDIDDWAVFVCFGLLFIVIVAACVLGVIYCIASKGDDELYDEYQGQTALQRQRANQEAEEKARKLYGADYPVSNSNSSAAQSIQQQRHERQQLLATTTVAHSQALIQVDRFSIKISNNNSSSVTCRHSQARAGNNNSQWMQMARHTKVDCRQEVE
jgi:hypothetical protein